MLKLISHEYKYNHSLFFTRLKIDNNRLFDCVDAISLHQFCMNHLNVAFYILLTDIFFHFCWNSMVETMNNVGMLRVYSLWWCSAAKHSPPSHFPSHTNRNLYGYISPQLILLSIVWYDYFIKVGANGWHSYPSMVLSSVNINSKHLFNTKK